MTVLMIVVVTIVLPPGSRPPLLKREMRKGREEDKAAWGEEDKAVWQREREEMQQHVNRLQEEVIRGLRLASAQ